MVQVVSRFGALEVKAPPWLHWLFAPEGMHRCWVPLTEAQYTLLPVVVSRLAAAPRPSPPITWLKVVEVAAESRKRVPLSCKPMYARNGLPVAGSPDATEYAKCVGSPR